MHKWKTTNKMLVLINVFQLEFGPVSADTEFKVLL